MNESVRDDAAAQICPELLFGLPAPDQAVGRKIDAAGLAVDPAKRWRSLGDYTVSAKPDVYFEVQIGTQTADPAEWFGI